MFSNRILSPIRLISFTSIHVCMSAHQFNMKLPCGNAIFISTRCESGGDHVFGRVCLSADNVAYYWTHQSNMFCAHLWLLTIAVIYNFLKKLFLLTAPSVTPLKPAGGGWSATASVWNLWKQIRLLVFSLWNRYFKWLVFCSLYIVIVVVDNMLHTQPALHSPRPTHMLPDTPDRVTLLIAFLLCSSRSLTFI